MKSPENKSNQYHLGTDPQEDAWHAAFFLENHLDHDAFPEEVASPEQIRFMVFTDNDERYYPCSDETFQSIINKTDHHFLMERYNLVLGRILDLIETSVEQGHRKEYLKELIRIKFNHETRDYLMIPSRLEKRLFRIFYKHAYLEDPYHNDKVRRNKQVHQFLSSDPFKSSLNRIDLTGYKHLPDTLSDIREQLERIELMRLLSMVASTYLWEQDLDTDEINYTRLFDAEITGNGVNDFFKLVGINEQKGPDTFSDRKKILWVANESGEFLVDMTIIRYLIRLGHKVIIAFKDGPHFTKVDFSDVKNDPVLQKVFEPGIFLEDQDLSKNDLIDILRTDRHLFMMSDGTREDLNLLYTSTTFARVFKEVDAIITRGDDQKRRIFDSHFEFTQDIFNLSAAEDCRSVRIDLKPKHEAVIRFSHQDLEQKAAGLIQKMKDARGQGMNVMFYSGIIGSIPGKIDEAKRIMTVFIDYLNTQLSETFIINPSNYYEPGMDADDLMYMWEIVQRSGYIDTWRFQTYEDIAMAFGIMNQKVPPEWVGKDATYSTGCTKEMFIALDVLNKHREMQLIGPPKEKFNRRKEYGVGKMFDKRLK